MLRAEHAATDAGLQRFLREAKALERIASEHCCKVLGRGDADGSPWLALEFIEGQSLEDLLSVKGSLAPPDAVAIVRQVLQGLGAVHEVGVVHRDVKPANIIVTRDGTVKLVDFGLARRSDESMLLTTAGSLLGTPAYMSPEQCAGETIDARSDLYSVGVLAFNLVAGKPPFQGRSVVEILKKQLDDPIPPLRHFKPDAPGSLDRFIGRCTRKDQGARFQTAREALAALDEVERAPAAPGPPAAAGGEPSGRRTTSRRAPVTTAVAPELARLADEGEGRGVAKLLRVAVVTIAAPLALLVSTKLQVDPVLCWALAVIVALVAWQVAGDALADLIPGAGAPKAPPRPVGVGGLSPRVEEAAALEKAGQHRHAAELQTGLNAHAKAARLFEQASDVARAVESFKLAGDLGEAAAVLERANRLDEAARLLAERVAELETARDREKMPSRLARIEGELSTVVERASKLFARAGSPADAARLLARTRRHREAADMYLAANDRQAAAAELVAAGELVRAAELHERAGDVVAAARIRSDQLLAAKDRAGAAAELERAGDFARAARLFSELGADLRAAELYDRAGEKLPAAALFERAGKHLRAAELFERSKQPRDAERCYRASGLDPAAVAKQRLAKVPAAEAPPASARLGPSDWIGRVVDRYRITDVLGAGAFADVYQAEHVHLERRVALKVLKPSYAARPNVAEGFLREAKLVSRLRHPGIAEVYDFGPVDGTFFMALELVSGRTLRAKLQGERRPRRGDPGGTALPLREAARIVRAILDAVHAAHKAGVIHRDLKPENVLEDASGGVRVVDFGMAKVFWGVTGSDGLQFAGTPPYASPEAARGDELDARADQYACGLIAYELLTGVLPFRSDSPAGWLQHHANTRPAPPSSKNPKLARAPEVDAVILRALAKSPADRFADVLAFSAALEPFTR